MSLVSSHVTEVLPVATSLATLSSKHFATIAQVLSMDVTGRLSLFVRSAK